MEARKQQLPHVALFPFPSHGHMIPMLDFAHDLAMLGFPLTILTTPANQESLTSLMEFASAEDLRIRCAVFPLTKTPLAGREGNPSALPLHLITAYIASFEQLSAPIEQWFRDCVSVPHEFGLPACIISDFFVGWTQKTASTLGIPRIVFYPSGAFAVSVINSLWKNLPDFGHFADDDPVPVPDLPYPASFRKFELSLLCRLYVKGEPASETVKESMLLNARSWGSVVNSFEELEKESIAHLEKQSGRPVWAVGPLLPPAVLGNEPAAETTVVARGKQVSAEVTECLHWLDSRKERSVVYVCFGSQAELSAAEIEVLAGGLEESGKCFVWAMGKMGSEAETKLPEGFKGRVKGRGFLIKGWAAQVALLSHPAIGCFLSHCGWNSALESVAMGVPLITWPLTADQYSNEYLIVEHLRAGVSVRTRRSRGAIQKERVRDAVQRMLTEGGCSEEAERASALRAAARQARSEGGASRNSLLELAKAVSVAAQSRSSSEQYFE